MDDRRLQVAAILTLLGVMCVCSSTHHLEQEKPGSPPANHNQPLHGDAATDVPFGLSRGRDGHSFTSVSKRPRITEMDGVHVIRSDKPVVSDQFPSVDAAKKLGSVVSGRHDTAAALVDYPDITASFIPVPAAHSGHEFTLPQDKMEHSDTGVTDEGENSHTSNPRTRSTCTELASELQISEINKERVTFTTTNDSPCFVALNGADIVADCTKLNLTNVSPAWFPENITIILLDYNLLSTIHNYTFAHLRNLTRLSLSNNVLTTLQLFSFYGLEQLQDLNLEQNRLSYVPSSLPPEVFTPLTTLLHLGLLDNMRSTYFMYKYNFKFPDYLFQNNSKLKALSIDIASEWVYFPPVFATFQNLTNVTISGNSVFVNESSFENIAKVRKLALIYFSNLSNFSDTALAPLNLLDDLTFFFVQTGVAQALKSLKPLVNRTLTRIFFEQVAISNYDRTASISRSDIIIDDQKTVYLREICVNHFSLRQSQIYYLTRTAFLSPLWKRCLKSIDLSLNPLNGIPFSVTLLTSFPFLQVVLMTDIIRTCYSHKSFISGVEQKNDPYCNIKNAPTTSDVSNERSASFHDTDLSPEYKSIEPFRLKCFSDSALKDFDRQGYIRFYTFSKLGRVLNARRLIEKCQVSVNVHFVNVNLTYLNFEDSGLTNFTGHLVGGDTIETLVLSSCNMNILADYFFDGACGLRELYMSSCNFNIGFISGHSDRLLQRLTRLRRLDLSSNSLTMLAAETFQVNAELEMLDLSRNRFESVPFNLKHTPRLSLLDLSDNSISTLEERVRSQLDALALVNQGFRLSLSGNVLSCTCDSIHFLAWLSSTSVTLDQDSNYMCISPGGRLSSLSEFADLDLFWRQCWGSFFLALSFIMMALIVIGYLTFFLIWKNQIFIKSTLVKYFLGYKLKSPTDYQIGVFIGYSDRHYEFPCFVLERFLAQELGLITYLHHRDQLLAQDPATSILTAINNSWRVILVCSDCFLAGEQWSVFTWGAALYCQTPENPNRVLVMTDQKYNHRVPREILSSVPDHNMIALPAWQLTNQLRTWLRTRLVVY